MANRKITIAAGGGADPEVCSIGPGDKVTFKPESANVAVDITFHLATPLIEWRAKKDGKGKSISGTVHNCVQMGDRFKYLVGPTMDKAQPLLAGPELIVDGGIFEEPARKQSGKRARKKR